jgi:uncharacterized protein YbjT (DUF2867 family)
LAAKDAYVRVLSRKPEAVRLPPGIDVIEGDLRVPETLEGCLAGVDSVFLIWTAPPAAMRPVLERVFQRVRRIVFLSAPLKTPHPFFQQRNPIRDLAARIEDSIESSGLEWTFLRPGIFAANSKHFWGTQIRAGNVVRWPYLGVPTAPIDERDIAAVAVLSLLQDGHGGMEYVLTGPQSLTQYQQISIIANVIGRPVRIEEITPEVARRELLTNIPEPALEMLLAAWAAAMGCPALVTSTYREITGTQARTFLEWASDHIAAFRP